MPDEGIIITELAGKRAVARAVTPADREALARLGFLSQDGQLSRAVPTEESRIALIRALIDIGALFSDGQDWCPAELVAHYREAGHIHQPFRVISWNSPSNFRIREA
ncbi:hypothetical protein UAJ10_08610 [Nitrospirillum sp. BR 11164]|uniref:hypothetical protein n=1 Tax=Nitrospirillum sp. BR 11164 TaxID=3104324 RepID=UPI002AFF5C0A|nr:hypothetical protein [Nitrospirillum sp. BR 11164]MEA1649080.1 hypothetical protein [Nitrospirillum sp. BR 11164]